jgi:hypothetical protein
MIIDKSTKLIVEKEALSGVKRVMGKLAGDFELVFGEKPLVNELDTDEVLSGSEKRVVAATVGYSTLLDRLEKEGRIDLSEVKGKWEVYSFAVLPAKEGEPETLLIAGSDKRGTIYGIFHLSELMGVSPWYWYADVTPVKKASVEITEKESIVSKEPSVRYRGFFINDEWPAFGTWTFSHFGGFTAEMYDHVFELLLRLKGNYLWPAMWTSNFSLDGPGLENAILADDYGVVMSNSHHEPCLRHSEEWDKVKGDDTPYGTAWNFDKNKEGLTNYWRDGLKRNGKFENIITMGMRGERDSEVLGTTATLKDNIDYLKEVITVQNQLIKETISEDLDSTKRMLAIYKEVEKYFHGDETAEGLKTWDGLDGITCMLCEDNFGNLRTLPEEGQRDRKGGWGMYYHFDYHGDPISYEWINSTHIARTCEQMSQAYDYGVREIWIVNVGDLKPQEFPLSYFLDLAYDMEKWGQGNPDACEEYTKKFVNIQFAGLSDEQKENTVKLLEGYTRTNYIKKPEALNCDTYNPTNYGESDAMLDRANKLESLAEEMDEALKGSDIYNAYYQLITFPTCAAMNLLKMQLFAGKNHLFAKQGAVRANYLAKKVKECIDKDRELTKAYHELNGGKWSGLALSEHVGFTHWNDEECAYPIMMNVEPANRPRMIVSAGNKARASQGGDWTRQRLVLDEFLNSWVTESRIYVKNGAEKTFEFELQGLPDFITADKTKGTVGFVDSDSASSEEVITLKVDREKLKTHVSSDSEIVSSVVTVRAERVHVDIDILTSTCEDLENVPLIPEDMIRKEVFSYPGVGTCVMNELGLMLEMKDVKKLESGEGGEFKLLKGFGKYDGGLKAFPTTKTFIPGVDAPSAEFKFDLAEDHDVEITLVTAPNNPVVKGNAMSVGVTLNGGAVAITDTVCPGYDGGERSCSQWAEGVLTQNHFSSIVLPAKEGENTLKIYAMDPGVVLERILVRQSSTGWAEGYIGKQADWIND